MTERELFQKAVLEHLVDDQRVKARSKKKKGTPLPGRRFLAAAACLLLVTGLSILTIPSAQAAVQRWFSTWFSPEQYFQAAPEERTSEPTLDAIITKAGVDGTQIIKTEPDYAHYGKDFGFTLEEIAYDGEDLYISGTMSGAYVRPIVQSWTGGDTFRFFPNGETDENGNPKGELSCMENMLTLTLPDGQSFHGEISPVFSPEMEAAMPQDEGDTAPRFQNGVYYSSNPQMDAFLDTYLAENDVRFTGHLSGRGEALTGQVTGELSLRMVYFIPVDAVDEVLTAELGSVTFDADAWKAQTSSAAIGAGAELSGIHPVSMTFWQPEEERTGSDDLEIYHATRELDFAGAAYRLNEITFTPTDTVIGLSVTQPDGWSDAERLQHPIQFLFLLDWAGPIPEVCTDEMKKAGTIFLGHGPAGGFQMDDAARAAATEAYEANGWRQFETWYHRSELTPSQWAQAKTLTIIPYTEYHWEMTVRYDDGPEEPFSLRDGNVHTGTANHTGYIWEEQTSLFSDAAVTIRLDDYR